MTEEDQSRSALSDSFTEDDDFDPADDGFDDEGRYCSHMYINFEVNKIKNYQQFQVLWTKKRLLEV